MLILISLGNRGAEEKLGPNNYMLKKVTLVLTLNLDSIARRLILEI